MLSNGASIAYGFIEMRRRLADSIDAMAQAVAQQTDISTAPGENLVGSAILENPRFGEYSHNTIARFEELQSFTTMLRHEV
jgi:multidrug resistance protein MdtO